MNYERQLKEQNLKTALHLGIINWFQYLELWRALPVLVLAFFLTACGASGGGSDQKTTSSPDSSTPAIVAPTPDDPAPVVQDPDPVVTPPADPVVPPVEPPPVPTNLACFSNNGALCTGANLGSSMVSLNLEAMFTGGNPQLQVVVASINNDVSATAHAICAQPNGAGCYLHSVCINATILVVGGGQYPFTWCGNAVNTVNNTLKDQ